MGTPVKHHSKSKARRRRFSAYQLKVIQKVKCSNCGNFKLPHRVCFHCGFYKGKAVIIKSEKEKKKQK